MSFCRPQFPYGFYQKRKSIKGNESVHEFLPGSSNDAGTALPTAPGDARLRPSVYSAISGFILNGLTQQKEAWQIRFDSLSPTPL